MSLFSKLSLKHQTALSGFIEEVSTVCKPVVTELLSDALSIGAFRALLNKIVEEAKDLEVEALETIILVIV